MSSLSLPKNEPFTVPVLRGRTLRIARWAWLLVCGAATLTFFAALPFRYALLLHPSPTNLANLTALGLTPNFFATYSIFWELVIAIPNILVGVFIFWRCGEQRIALLTSLVLIVFSVGSGTLTPTIRALLGIHPALDFLQHTLQFISWYGFALFFYLFPNGRFTPGWTRWAAVVMLVFSLVWNYASETPFAPLHWPPALFIVVVFLEWGSWLVSQVYRYWRVSNAVERQQTKWVVLAVSAFILMMGIVSLVGAFIPGFDIMTEEQPTPQSFAFMLAMWLTSPIMAIIPASIAISIIRYRLWDIDLVINRALVYGALTASTIGLYVAVVFYLGRMVQALDRSIIAFLATGLIAVVFQPLRDALQRGVNRLMYGERDEPYAVLSRLRQRLDLAASPGDVLPAILETILQALKLPYATIRLRDQTVAVRGMLPPNAQPQSFPLLYRGEVIGHLAVSPRSAEENFTAGERRLLADIAHQAGAAAHNVSLTGELQRARERLVAAREEERRRLRRDLHDGLGPKLAGQALILEAVRDSLAADSPNRGLVDHLISDSQTIVQEVRELVHGLRPPALDDHGLAGALRLLAAQCESGKLHIDVSTPDPMPPLPAAVEVAAYRIAQEALTNVVKHARARACQVVLTVGEELEISIADDGVGVPADRRVGVGTVSMRERAEEIGGQCVIEAGEDGGTRVCARLPFGLPPHRGSHG
ncbi:MAG: sensor histidine kinase [Chloroflexi bacterium]|nr:sensor histidine kinase [Chloroflexota bacterium]